MIPKAQIYVDPRYQRNINDRLVARITANWSWVSCGCLHVAQRSIKDNFFVFDGQHRFQAAKLIPSISELPCIVFALEDVKDEALGFLAANTERRIPTLADQFRALTLAKDPAALALQDYALKSNRIVGAPSDAGHISCVSDCIKAIRQDALSFDRAFPVIAELCEGRSMTGRIIRALSYLEAHCPPNTSILDERWRRRIMKVGYDTLTRSIKETTLFENNGNDATCAQGVLRALNKGLHEHLEIEVRTRKEKI
jgi:hypothetical protein